MPLSAYPCIIHAELKLREQTANPDGIEEDKQYADSNNSSLASSPSLVVQKQRKDDGSKHLTAPIQRAVQTSSTNIEKSSIDLSCRWVMS